MADFLDDQIAKQAAKDTSQDTVNVATMPESAPEPQPIEPTTTESLTAAPTPKPALSSDAPADSDIVFDKVPETSDLMFDDKPGAQIAGDQIRKQNIGSALKNAFSFSPSSIYKTLTGTMGAMADVALPVMKPGSVAFNHEDIERGRQILALAGSAAIGGIGMAGGVGVAGLSAYAAFPALFTAEGAVSPALEAYAKGQKLSAGEALNEGTINVINRIAELMGNPADKKTSDFYTSMLTALRTAGPDANVLGWTPKTDFQRRKVAEIVAAGAYLATAPSMIRAGLEYVGEGGQIALDVATDITEGMKSNLANAPETIKSAIGEGGEAIVQVIDNIKANGVEAKDVKAWEQAQIDAGASPTDIQELRSAINDFYKQANEYGAKSTPQDLALQRILANVEVRAQGAEAGADVANLRNEVVSPENAVIRSGEDPLTANVEQITDALKKQNVNLTKEHIDNLAKYLAGRRMANNPDETMEDALKKPKDLKEAIATHEQETGQKVTQEPTEGEKAQPGADLKGEKPIPGVIYERKSTDERRIVRQNANGKWYTQWHVPGETSGAWVLADEEDIPKLEQGIKNGEWKPQQEEGTKVSAPKSQEIPSQEEADSNHIAKLIEMAPKYKTAQEFFDAIGEDDSDIIKQFGYTSIEDFYNRAIEGTPSATPKEGGGIWYHGSPTGELNYGEQAKGNQVPFGVHFTSDKSLSEGFASGKTKGKPIGGRGKIVEATITATNPFNMTKGVYKEGSPEYKILKEIADKSGLKGVERNFTDRIGFTSTPMEGNVKAINPDEVMSGAKLSVVKSVLKENGYDLAIKYSMRGSKDPLGMGSPVYTDAIAVLDKSLVKLSPKEGGGILEYKTIGGAQYAKPKDVVDRLKNGTGNYEIGDVYFNPHPTDSTYDKNVIVAGPEVAGKIPTYSFVKKGSMLGLPDNSFMPELTPKNELKNLSPEQAKQILQLSPKEGKEVTGIDTNKYDYFYKGAKLYNIKKMEWSYTGKVLQANYIGKPTEGSPKSEKLGEFQLKDLEIKPKEGGGKIQGQAVTYYIDEFAKKLSTETGQPKEQFIPTAKKLVDAIEKKDVMYIRSVLNGINPNSNKLFTDITGLPSKLQRESDESIRSLDPAKYDEIFKKKPKVETPKMSRGDALKKAQEAKADKALDKQVKYDNVVMTKRAMVEKLVKEGYISRIEEQADDKAMRRLMDERRDLGRNGMQNINAAKIKELDTRIEAGVKKTQYHLVSPDQSFLVVSKAEYDYFNSLQAQIKVEPLPGEAVKPYVSQEEKAAKLKFPKKAISAKERSDIANRKNGEEERLEELGDGAFLGQDENAFYYVKRADGTMVENPTPLKDEPGEKPTPTTAFLYDDEAIEAYQEEKARLLEESLNEQTIGTLFKDGNISTEEAAKGEAPAIKEEADAEADDDASQIADFGEKIGGARKDLATKTGPAGIKKEKKEGPAWAHDIKVMQKIAVYEGDKNVGKWFIAKVTNRHGRGSVDRLTNKFFDTEAEANAYIPLAVVAQNHRVYGTTVNAEKNGYVDFSIHRILSSGKRPIVKGGFKTNEEAMTYMANHPEEIIEHKFDFPEKPWLDRIERVGKDYRNGKDVTTKMFQEKFGFRGGEFGNWNMGSDGQAALNYAYDALLDLADTLGIYPKALSLNGQLSIAFGARGHGLSSARAHFEEDRFVINLTKIKGAGSLAHEWLHAVDSYLAMLDGKMPSKRNEDGTFTKTGKATEGFSYDSKLSKDIIDSFKALIKNITSKEVEKTIAVDWVKKGVDRATSGIRDTVSNIDRGFKYDYTKYNKRAKTATAKDIAKWEALKEKLLNSDYGEKVFVKGAKTNKFGGFDSYQIIRDMNDLYKAVTGHSFDRADDNSTGRTLYRQLRSLADAKDRVKQAEAGATQKTNVATDYLKEAKEIDSYRSSDYWSLPHEMAARAFESYIYDKLIGKANRSDYLVYAVENKYYAGLGLKPYPEGDERELSNKSFDNLFKTMHSTFLKSDREGYVMVDLLIPPVIQKMTTELVNVLSPTTGVPVKNLDAIMTKKGDLSQEEWILETKLHAIKEDCQKWPKQEQINFIDRKKRGEPQQAFVFGKNQVRTAEYLQALADMLTTVEDANWEEAKKFKPTLAYLENHFRVLWKIIPGSENAKRRGFKGNFRRPLQGTKGFMKQHTLDDMSEGLEMGGEPYSYNPIAMWIMAQLDMQKFITANRMFAEGKKNGWIKFIRSGKSAPDGFVKINDSIAKVYFRVDEGLINAGEWYCEENTGRILNNFLSRDWVRESAIGGSLIKFKNVTTAIELSLSPFHFSFVSVEAMLSSMGLAMQEMLNVGIYQANPAAFLQGLKDFFGAAAAPAVYSKIGSNVKKFIADDQWINSKDGQDFIKLFPNAMDLIHDAFVGGLNVGQNRDFQINSLDAFKEGIKNKEPWAMVICAIPAANQVIMKPLFNIYIPNIKWGFFMREMSNELVQRSAQLKSGKLTRAQLARMVVRSVENRFGEMNFDNRFWNRGVKSMLQILFRSVTWKTGALENIGGAVPNQIKEIMDAIDEGRPPLLNRNFAWLVALLFLVALYDTILQELYIGEAPKSMLDLIAPRYNKQGNRVTLNTYLKEVFHFIHNPVKYVTNSLTGEIGRIIEVLQNKDFYNTEIAHPGDPWIKQKFDQAWHLIPKPFSLVNQAQERLHNAPIGIRVMTAAGLVQPAAGYMTETKAEGVAKEILANHDPVGGRTKEAFQKGQLRSQLRQGYQQTGDTAPLIQASRSGEITRREAYDIRKNANVPDLVRITHSFTFAEMTRVMDKATPEEKNSLQHKLRTSYQTALNETTNSQSRQALRQIYEKYRTK